MQELVHWDFEGAGDRHQSRMCYTISSDDNQRVVGR
jgi:hypothetical protein